MRGRPGGSGALVACLLLLSACSSGDSARRTLIQNKGSDTMVNIAQSWAENYRAVAPDVGVAVSGGGSGTGIAALMNGTVDIANASRSIKPAEREQIKTNNGIEVVEHTVAADAVAFFVHSDNPLDGLTLGQLACIYGEGGDCENWADVGAQVPGCAGQQIIRISRQSNSGTYVFVRESVLGKTRDFRLGSRDMQGSKDVVDLVSKTPCSIGYSGLGYATDELKTICVSQDGESVCVVPTTQAAKDGSYPLSRPLFMYTLGEPQGQAAVYLNWIKSAAGQEIVVKTGFIPIS